MKNTNVLTCCIAVLSTLSVSVQAQELLVDTGVAGPPLEVVHYYYGGWPTGKYPLVLYLFCIFFQSWNTKRDKTITVDCFLRIGVGVSKSGRIFTAFPPGFDPNNTFDGSNGRFSVGELKSKDSEVSRTCCAMCYRASTGRGAMNYSILLRYMLSEFRWFCAAGLGRMAERQYKQPSRWGNQLHYRSTE